jgi:hypothetical protein
LRENCCTQRCHAAGAAGAAGAAHKDVVHPLDTAAFAQWRFILCFGVQRCLERSKNQAELLARVACGGASCCHGSRNIRSASSRGHPNTAGELPALHKKTPLTPPHRQVLTSQQRVRMLCLDTQGPVQRDDAVACTKCMYWSCSVVFLIVHHQVAHTHVRFPSFTARAPINGCAYT